MTLDRRRHAHRPDLADARLRGRVEAERYVDGAPAMMGAPYGPLRPEPHVDASVDATVLMGEPLLVFERWDGWAWVQSQVDDYVGYAPEAWLSAPAPATHVVTGLSAHLYPAPDVKTPIVDALPMGARIVCGEETVDGFRRTLTRPNGAAASDLWIAETALRPIDGPPEADWVAIAERFLGTPYLWGGKTYFGLDCSGLVQIARQMAGDASVPRDSDMQSAECGVELASDAPLRRGDLVFWRGHVGVMRDGETLLHANAGAMACASESLAHATARIAAGGYGAVTSRRRLSA